VEIIKRLNREINAGLATAKRLNREINAGLATADIRARLSDVGTIPMILNAAEFGAFVAAEAEKWTKVVKFAGIKPE
jgi:tripartite-type tricarboxylate transporter receptor subunit TctC